MLLVAQSRCTAAQDLRGSAPDSEPRGIVPNGKYYALVIGINEYPAPLNKLKTAVNDAKTVGSLLHQQYGFAVQYLLDGEATRFKILSVLSDMRRSLSEDDSLLIYYGGHGYFDRETDKAYWLPVDADSGNSPNTIMADDLTSLIRAMPPRHVLIVSDSCYSGGLSREAAAPVRIGTDPALLARELRSRSRTLMASGGLEPVADSGENGHSVFANAILRALEQAPDPMFTAIDLFYSSIRRQVAGKSSQLPLYTPIRNSNDDDGDFIFKRNTAYEPVPAPPPALAAGVLRSDSTSDARGLTETRMAELIEAGKYSEAFPLFKGACEGGNAAGCAWLAYLYLSGKGVDKDELRAAGLFRKACDSSNAAGCSGLGAMYRDGQGVGKDETAPQIYSAKPAMVATLVAAQVSGTSMNRAPAPIRTRLSHSDSTARDAKQAMNAAASGSELLMTVALVWTKILPRPLTIIRKLAIQATPSAAVTWRSISSRE